MLWYTFMFYLLTYKIICPSFSPAFPLSTPYPAWFHALSPSFGREKSLSAFFPTFAQTCTEFSWPLTEKNLSKNHVFLLLFIFFFSCLSYFPPAFTPAFLRHFSHTLSCLKPLIYLYVSGFYSNILLNLADVPTVRILASPAFFHAKKTEGYQVFHPIPLGLDQTLLFKDTLFYLRTMFFRCVHYHSTISFAIYHLFLTGTRVQNFVFN